MVDQKLMDNSNRLGFPLMETQAEVDTPYPSPASL